MSPNLNDRLWLVLYQVDDGFVWFDGRDWWSQGVGKNARVTGAIHRLWQLGLVAFPKTLRERDKPSVTTDGMALLKARSVYDVLDKRA